MTTGVVARADLPTAFGVFDAIAFERPSGFVYLALVRGALGDGRSVLARVHSECLTGDALASVRCDCGVQLRGALGAIAAEDRGVLVYATGHEGRGIGLVNKLRAYFEQDRGADTVDANLHLGLPVDGRRYEDAAEVLRALGVRSVRLLTNNLAKAQGLERSGVEIESVRGFPVAAQLRNLSYLKTKEERFGHVSPIGKALVPHLEAPPDVTTLLGPVHPPKNRPYVALKYAQSIDGRIATTTRDSKWISGKAERTVAHALRARCDAIMVGVGTIVADDPQLTVRLVTGASPQRVVLDSTLRIPLDARVLNGDAPTLVITTDRADRRRLEQLRRRDIGVRVAARGRDGVDTADALRVLRNVGIESVLVEGGAAVITSVLADALLDRLIVSIAPTVLGRGVDAVGDLGVDRVRNGVALKNSSVYVLGDDVVMASDIANGHVASLPLRDARVSSDIDDRGRAGRRPARFGDPAP